MSRILNRDQDLFFYSFFSILPVSPAHISVQSVACRIRVSHVWYTAWISFCVSVNTVIQAVYQTCRRLAITYIISDVLWNVTVVWDTVWIKSALILPSHIHAVYQTHTRVSCAGPGSPFPPSFWHTVCITGSCFCSIRGLSGR